MSLVAVAASDVTPGDTLFNYGLRIVVAVEAVPHPLRDRLCRTRVFFRPNPQSLPCYFEFDPFTTVWISR